MKLRTFMLGGALALAAVSGLAQADDQDAAAKPVPYHYGMPMNIAKVLAMNEAPTMTARSSTRISSSWTRRAKSKMSAIGNCPKPATSRIDGRA